MCWSAVNLPTAGEKPGVLTLTNDNDSPHIDQDVVQMTSQGLAAIMLIKQQCHKNI